MNDQVVSCSSLFCIVILNEKTAQKTVFKGGFRRFSRLYILISINLPRSDPGHLEENLLEVKTLPVHIHAACERCSEC